MSPSHKTYDCVVIGGGAAGFFGAITLANSPPGARVAILEATKHPLTKVAVSGGGRCNVTHNCFDPAELITHYPRGSVELRGPFSRFQPRETVSWFEDRGVPLKAEADGRIFPTTDNSQTVIDCLLLAVGSAGVEIRLDSRVVGIRRNETGPRFSIRDEAGAVIDTHRILLATGSSALGYNLARALGHTIVPPVPSLFTFKLSDPRLEGLAGVACPSVSATISAGGRIVTKTGPLLITHWGLSGPAILRLSAWAARELHTAKYQAALTVNLTGALSAEETRELLREFRETHGRKRVASGCDALPIPRRLWERLVAHVGVSLDLSWSHLSREQLATLVEEIVAGVYAVRGKGEFKEEFVTAGGIALEEVNFRTMESRVTPGVYFAGEILDIDGVTGGFNFQSSWTTGWIAGQALAEAMAGDIAIQSSPR